MIIGVQWVFYLFFFALYLVSSKTAHRVVGYFEEEAVISYTHYLAEIDGGRSQNVPAPQIAKVPKAIIDKRTAFPIMPQAYRNAVSVAFR